MSTGSIVMRTRGSQLEMVDEIDSLLTKPRWVQQTFIEKHGNLSRLLPYKQTLEFSRDKDEIRMPSFGILGSI